MHTTGILNEEQRVLHFARTHLEAAGFDEVCTFAPDDAQGAVLFKGGRERVGCLA